MFFLKFRICSAYQSTRCDRGRGVLALPLRIAVLTVPPEYQHQSWCAAHDMVDPSVFTVARLVGCIQARDLMNFRTHFSKIIEDNLRNLNNENIVGSEANHKFTTRP